MSAQDPPFAAPAAGPLAWHRFARLDEACAALAETVAIRLRALVAAKGGAVLAVPGGTTPGPFLAELARADLPWRQVTLLPTDERFVAADDAASNERMLRRHFAPLDRGEVDFVSFHGYGSDIEAAAAALCQRLAELPPLDLLVSGMGADGHIASLFPGAEALDPRRPDSGIDIARPLGLPPRLSLSPARLAGAGWAALLISGAAKEAVLDGQRAERLPVDILRERPQGLDVYWANT